MNLACFRTDRPLSREHSSGEAHVACLVGDSKSGFDWHRLEIGSPQFQPAAFDGRRALFQNRRPHKSRRPPRQLRPAFDAEFAKQRRDMEFHGSHRDVQLRRDFLVCAVVHHGVQHFPLPLAQRSRAGGRSPLLQQILRACDQLVHKRRLGRDHDLEIPRVLPTDQALHRQQPRDSLYRAAEIGIRSRSKLRHSRLPLAENKQVRQICFPFLLLLYELRKCTDFLHDWPSRLLAQGCIRQS
jgi:hypothetical protein